MDWNWSCEMINLKLARMDRRDITRLCLPLWWLIRPMWRLSWFHLYAVVLFYCIWKHIERAIREVWRLLIGRGRPSYQWTTGTSRCYYCSSHSRGPTNSAAWLTTSYPESSWSGRWRGITLSSLDPPRSSLVDTDYLPVSSIATTPYVSRRWGVRCGHVHCP